MSEIILLQACSALKDRCYVRCILALKLEMKRDSESWRYGFHLILTRLMQIRLYSHRRLLCS